jgi:uncharacterized Rossmann fold enzyme
MDQKDLLIFYNEIVEDFGFSREKDYESAFLLNKFLKKPDLKFLENLIYQKEVNIFGAGPSLDNLSSIPKGVNVAADGVCTFLLKMGVIPDIVVTDLDGKIDDLLRTNNEGSKIVLHAHGDNIGLIGMYSGKFSGLYGTTQTYPFGNLLNFGGFTDGDRAGFLVEHFKPKKITFYGMDFDEEPGQYSFASPEKVSTKKRKLLWAKRLIQYLIEISEVEININSH